MKGNGWIWWLVLLLTLMWGQWPFAANASVTGAAPIAKAKKSGLAADGQEADGRSVAILEHELRGAGKIALSPRALVQLVIARNADTLYRQLQTGVAASLATAQRGIYDTTFFSKLKYQDSKQPSSQLWQQQALGTNGEVIERDATSEIGVRRHFSTGADVSLSYSYNKQAGNLLAGSGPEYYGTLSLTIKQPLLRGRGGETDETKLRVAELDRDITRQQYRQQVLITAGKALQGYCRLYRALASRRIRTQALDNVHHAYDDVKARVDHGWAPRTDLLEARITIASRKVQLTKAEREVAETRNQLKSLLALSGPAYEALKLRTTGPLATSAFDKPLAVRLHRALKNWPQLRIAELQRRQNEIRLHYAKNQRLAQLDLVGGYNLHGGSEDSYQAFRDSWGTQLPGWYLGLNLEYPLDNTQARAQYEAQAIRMRQADLQIKSIRQNVANDLENRWNEVLSARRERQQIEQEVTLRKEVLDVEQTRYKRGQAPLQEVFDREDELSDSQYRLLASGMRLALARVALMLVDGSLLAEYGVEVKGLK